MNFGDTAKNLIRAGEGREISKDEALEIIRQNEAAGLVLQPSNTKKTEFVCSCCGCCCGILNLHKFLPKPVQFWATNYYAEVDPERCTSCGTCVDRCMTNAMHLNERLNIAKVDLDRCLGCVNCVSTCPSEAISLIKKGQETIPPKDMKNLYDIIMANKKGILDKMKLAAKIVLKL